ncbi:MAG: hypothetical protein ACE5DN_02950 [Flavobacteriales bacterium]
MNFAVKIITIALCFSIGGFEIISAQTFTLPCKSFGKKACKSVNLEDYSSNGQLTVAPLVPGEEAELSMIFYRGNDYRIVLCGDEELGQLKFWIKNSRGEELFNNKNYENTQQWDFSMSSTQRLIIVVGAEGKTQMGEAVEEGCVKLIIGHRKTPKAGFY